MILQTAKKWKVLEWRSKGFLHYVPLGAPEAKQQPAEGTTTLKHIHVNDEA